MNFRLESDCGHLYGSHLEYWREIDLMGREYWVSAPYLSGPRAQPDRCVYDPDLS